MPINKYFGGHGDKVMKNMKDSYGDKKGESVFYATANKKKQGKESMRPTGEGLKKIFGKKM